jgi:hypothetical protein
MDPYKGLQNVSNCIHTEYFYPMGIVTFGSLCICHIKLLSLKYLFATICAFHTHAIGYEVYPHFY